MRFSLYLIFSENKICVIFLSFYFIWFFCRWFHSVLSSSKAEEILLREENDDGSFLVRPSESTEGDFTISVKYATLIML